jgi:hypothetical protein
MTSAKYLTCIKGTANTYIILVGNFKEINHFGCVRIGVSIIQKVTVGK